MITIILFIFPNCKKNKAAITSVLKKKGNSVPERLNYLPKTTQVIGEDAGTWIGTLLIQQLDDDLNAVYAHLYTSVSTSLQLKCKIVSALDPRNWSSNRVPKKKKGGEEGKDFDSMPIATIGWGQL